MSELLQMILGLLLAFGSQGELPARTAVDVVPRGSGYRLVCVAGCDEWAAYGPEQVREMAYGTHDEAVNAFALMRAVRYGCAFVPVEYAGDLGHRPCDFGFYVFGE